MGVGVGMGELVWASEVAVGGARENVAVDVGKGGINISTVCNQIDCHSTYRICLLPFTQASSYLVQFLSHIDTLQQSRSAQGAASVKNAGDYVPCCTGWEVGA